MCSYLPQLVAVDKTLSNLDLAAFTLEDNIADKDTTLSMEERMALLDGRINLTTAPPSSVGSVSARGTASLYSACGLHLCVAPRDGC
jgi:hypothetical protein